MVNKNSKLHGQWFVEFTHKDIGKARTIIQFNPGDSTFSAHTRKNADKDIIGVWKSLLAKTFTDNFKNGSLLTIDRGKYRAVSDTVFLAGILSSPIGKYNVIGFVVSDQMHLEIRTKSTRNIGSIIGSKELPSLPMEKYDEVFEKAATLTNEKIYNPKVLSSKDWKRFSKDMKKITPTLQDDLEMIFAFYYKSRKLPFSHYALMKPLKTSLKDTDKNGKTAHLLLEEKNKNTAYLKIKSFEGSADEIDSTFKIIKKNAYKNLIVDFRNNTGGSVEAGIAFASKLFDTTSYGGVFLTKKWFNNHDYIPTPDNYSQFDYFSQANYDLIIEGIHKKEALYLKIIPQKPNFSGKLYMLTNNNTASTCEPIIYELKKQKRATIVGEKTAGAMLNGEFFDLNNGFKIVIPTADYYTSDGYRIDQNGVKPDIEVHENEALEFVMNDLLK